MTPKKTAGPLCLAIVVMCAACSSGVTPPDNPGAAEALVGTQWLVGDTVISFGNLPNGSVAKVRSGGTPGPPVPMVYDVQDGVVTVNVLGDQQMGTWDGTTLTLGGVDGVRR